MTNKYFQRKRIKIIAILIVLTGLFYLTGEYLQIEIKGTINTKYTRIEDSEHKIIETEYFKLLAPKSWFHIFSGYGVEGDPYGYFWTKKGLIHYEYGRFGPDYDKLDVLDEFKKSKKKVNRFLVNIAINEKKETGIAIPVQNEMSRSFTFYASESVTSNYNDLLNSIAHLEFTK